MGNWTDGWRERVARGDNVIGVILNAEFPETSARVDGRAFVRRSDVFQPMQQLFIIGRERRGSVS